MPHSVPRLPTNWGDVKRPWSRAVVGKSAAPPLPLPGVTIYQAQLVLEGCDDVPEGDLVRC